MKFNFCVACLASKDLHHHHLLPKVKGGTDDETNLITLCSGCHKTIHGQSWSGVDHQKLTQRGVFNAKTNGKRWTHSAYGWTFRDGIAKKCEREQKIVREIVRRHDAGESYADITRELNRRKIKPKRSAEWEASAVRYIYLRNS